MIFSSALRKMLPCSGIHTYVRKWAEAGICRFSESLPLARKDRWGKPAVFTNRECSSWYSYKKLIRNKIYLPRCRRMWFFICTCVTAKSHFLQSMLLTETSLKQTPTAAASSQMHTSTYFIFTCLVAPKAKKLTIISMYFYAWFEINQWFDPTKKDWHHFWASASTV